MEKGKLWKMVEKWKTCRKGKEKGEKGKKLEKEEKDENGEKEKG